VITRPSITRQNVVKSHRIKSLCSKSGDIDDGRFSIGSRNAIASARVGLRQRSRSSQATPVRLWAHPVFCVEQHIVYSVFQEMSFWFLVRWMVHIEQEVDLGEECADNVVQWRGKSLHELSHSAIQPFQRLCSSRTAL